MKPLLALFLLCAATFSASANEAAIRQALDGRFSGAKVESVHPTSIPGIFEVVIRARGGVDVVYTDATATHVIVGPIYETKTKRNLTDERMKKLLAIKFESLPLEHAVKVTRGNGRRVLAIFSDPYCPACRSFEAELAKLENVTIHYFMYPVIRPELADHSKAVWCSKDRAKAWLDLAQRHKVPTAVANCDTPIDKVLEFGRTLGVGSTPTLFLGNGERISGGMAAERLSALMDTILADQAKGK